MRKNKITGNSRSTKATHYCNKGDNMEYRPLYPVMNRVSEYTPVNNKPIFKSFINVITILVAFWVIVGFLIWMFT